jgi:hypothetical protein
MIRSIGEVTSTKFSPSYTQIIIHGSFSRPGMYCAIRGRITSKMPAIIKIMRMNLGQIFRCQIITSCWEMREHGRF